MRGPQTINKQGPYWDAQRMTEISGEEIQGILHALLFFFKLALEEILALLGPKLFLNNKNKTKQNTQKTNPTFLKDLSQFLVVI